MLRGLTDERRDHLEHCCEPYSSEVARFCGLYPEILNKDLIRALQVEARLRAATGAEKSSGVQHRRDGVLYI